MNDRSIKEMNIKANDHSLVEFITIVFQRKQYQMYDIQVQYIYVYYIIIVSFKIHFIRKYQTKCEI